MRFFTQFMSYLFGGATLGLISIYYFFLQYGFSTPSYENWITIIATIIGYGLVDLLYKKIKNKTLCVMLAVYFTLLVCITLIMGIEDWKSALILSIVSIIYTILPAFLITLISNWGKFSKN